MHPVSSSRRKSQSGSSAKEAREQTNIITCCYCIAQACGTSDAAGITAAAVVFNSSFTESMALALFRGQCSRITTLYQMQQDGQKTFVHRREPPRFMCSVSTFLRDLAILELPFRRDGPYGITKELVTGPSS